MSIEDDQKAIIRLGTVHSWIFKLSLYLMPLFGLWAVKTIVQHDADIRVLQMQVLMMGGGKFGDAVSNASNAVASATNDESCDK